MERKQTPVLVLWTSVIQKTHGMVSMDTHNSVRGGVNENQLLLQSNNTDQFKYVN